MIADADRFQKISSGVQSIILAVAVVVGGGWTFYLSKLTLEPRLELTLEVRQADLNQNSGHRVAIGELVVKNVGTGNTLLKFGAAPIHLFRVGFANGKEARDPIGTFDFESPQNPNKKLDGLSCQVNANNRASFAFSVGEAGLYVVSVTAARGKNEAAAVVDDSTQPAEVDWAIERYFTLN
jgi:hypothetical protein